MHLAPPGVPNSRLAISSNGPRGMAPELCQRIAKDVIEVVADQRSPSGWPPPVRRFAPAARTSLRRLKERAAQAATVAKTLELKGAR